MADAEYPGLDRYHLAMLTLFNEANLSLFDNKLGALKKSIPVKVENVLSWIKAWKICKYTFCHNVINLAEALEQQHMIWIIASQSNENKEKQESVEYDPIDKRRREMINESRSKSKKRKSVTMEGNRLANKEANPLQYVQGWK